MAKKTKVRILRGGSPMEGIHVMVVPMVGKDQLTDEDGRVAFDWPEDSSGWVTCFVWGDEIGDTSAIFQLEDEEDHAYDIQPLPE